MSETRRTTGAAGIAALRRLSRLPPTTAAEEKCELCGRSLAPRHRHLLEMETRRIVCACDPCATCFQGVVGGRYRLIPREARALTDFVLTDSQWESLALPIDLAFIFRHTPANRVIALYPGPAGTVESLLPLTTWRELVSENPVLAGMAPDVEALLINRVGIARRYYLAPIDACFRLVGLIRIHWRGLFGGAEVWREINAFFDELELHEVSHA